jgi:hypothetical protein
MEQQIPKLSHITNLPDFRQGMGNRERAAGGGAQKTLSAFGAKLKSILREKELPAAPVELELEAVKSVKSPPKADPPLAEKVESVKPEPFTLKVPVPPKPKIATAPILPMPLPPILPKPAAPDKKEVVLNKALNLKPKDAVQPSASLKSSAPKIPPQAQAAIKPTNAPNGGGLQSLQDLSMLEAGILKTSSPDDLIKKVKALIGRYGYFEAIFQIEKSPVYKSYIATGLKMLSGKSDFGEGGGFLTKQEFENFTDLLAKIQSS